MLGVSGFLGNSGGDGDAPDSGGEPGGVGSNADDKITILAAADEADHSSGGGNRWPRPETLALLKIRSDMDVAFREATLKAPLWDDVSRKLAELGYHRSAKKCKEKFENVYKYHKRTKDGRASKPDGKTYRFFDQLEALDTHPPALPSPAVTMPATNPPPVAVTQVVTVPSTNPVNNTIPQFTVTQVTPITVPPPPPPFLQPPPALAPAPAPAMNPANNPVNQMFNSTSSSSTSSDEEPERRGKRKRKWEYFFQRLMKEVIDKQEEMQKNFLEALEKRERDRMAREEAWRVQEMARMNREHDRLVHERSAAANKDAAVIAYLQKVSDQKNPIQTQTQPQIQLQENIPIPITITNPIPNQNPNQIPNQIPIPIPIPISIPPPPPPLQMMTTLPLVPAPAKKTDNGGESFSSRWPKSEVQALIQLRTDLDIKYQENGPKGPLWEEISAAMKRVGYNRSSKRCKEKWENINKYFKKVKESNKKRPEDSKTCPYFHQLDALYRDRNKGGGDAAGSKPENPMVPIMVRPEQQWPLPQDPPLEEHGSDDGDDEDDEDEGGGYEVVANKPSGTDE